MPGVSCSSRRLRYATTLRSGPMQSPRSMQILNTQSKTLRGRTFLRPGGFATNALWWWGAQIRRGDVVRWPYGPAALAPIHEQDIAAVAVRALRDDGHRGKK